MTSEETALATTLALQEGLAALDEGDATTALDCFERALALEPGAPAAERLRALALARLHPRPEAPTPSPDPAQEPPWEPGEIIEGRWEVFGSARGGMGRVYFVRDREWHGMELAVKSLLPRPGADGAEVARAQGLFRREARVWMDLGAHPHIVSGFYSVPVRGALRFFIEYVPGRTLEALARAEGGRLAPARAVDLAIQLASGVSHLHARGVVHRDVKPANCLVLSDDALKLTDFGLGKAAAERDAASVAGSLPAAGALGLSIAGAGTPTYMAPEQWRSLGDAGAAADVYALGVVLYEVLTGAAPFDAAPSRLALLQGRLPARVQRVVDRGRASSALLLWLLHAEVSPPSLSASGVQLPPALEELVRACLAKSPSERPTIGAVRDGLQRAFSSLTGRAYDRELPGALPPTEAGESNRAVSYYAMGDAARAREILDGWLERHPTALHPWINRRALALTLGEFEAPPVALAFERDLVPVHLGAVSGDPHVATFRRRLRRYAPYARGPVASASFHPEGGLLALAAGDAVLLVRADDGEPLATLEGHDAGVTSVTWDPRGERLATTSYDRTARVWDARARIVHRVLEGHRDCVTCAAFDPTGRLLLTGGGASYQRVDRMARVWDLARSALVALWRGHQDALASVAWSPSGALAATASADGVVGLWDPRSGSLVYTFDPEADAPQGASIPLVVGFVEGGRRLFIARRGGAVELFRTDSGQRERALSLGPITAAACGRDGRLVAVGDAEGRLVVVDTVTGAPLREVETGIGRVLGLTVSPDGAAVGVCGEGGAQRWDVAPGESAKTPWPLVIDPPMSASGRLGRERERARLESRLAARDLSSYRPLQALRARTPEYQRDATLVESVHRAGSAGGCRVGVRDAWVVRTLELDADVVSLGFSEGGREVRVATVGGAGLVARAWSLERGEVTSGLAVDAGATSAVALSPDGRYLLAGGPAGALSLGRTTTGRVVRRLAEQGHGITAVGFSPDGLTALTGDESGLVRAWSVGTGELLRTLRGHHYGVSAVAFDAEGALALTGGWDRTARLWELSSGRCLAVLSGHRAGVSAVAIDAEARRVITCGDDGALLWSTSGGPPLAHLQGHEAGVTAATFAGDGRLVLTGGWDGAVRGHRTGDGAPVCELPGHPHGVTALAASHGGLQVVTAGADHVVRLWLLDGDWVFAEELLPDAESLLATGEAPRCWPRASGEADLDAWLDVWRDVRHATVRSGLAPEVLARAESVRAALFERLAVCAEGLAPAGEAFTADPVWRASRVDPALASALAARLGR